MKKEENIDELLQQAFSDEDAEVLKKMEDHGLFDLMLSNFQGKLKWIAYYTTFLILVFFVSFIYCLIEFVNALEIRNMLLWGAGMFGSLLLVMLLKMWHWMQIDKNSLAREIKRLEFQISLLAKK